MRILVTGASGFIGSFIVERALALGHDVWAGIRPSSSRQWLGDKRIRFIHLDFSDLAALTATLRQQAEAEGGFDYVVHAAGATKARDEAAFLNVNCGGTQRLVEALVAAGHDVKRFVMLSSFSVVGAPRERQRAADTDGFVYEPIDETVVPQPNSAYGRSKWAAEQYLKAHCPFPYIILRPTGVYGPRERDYFMMVQSVNRHIDFAVGFTRQEITFVYVKDVVEAVVLAFEHGTPGAIYHLSDGCTYTSRTFGQLIQKALGKRWVARLTAPLWILKAVCSVSQWAATFTHKPTALNNDKYNILKQRNWRCDISKAQRELGYAPQYPLQRGVEEMVAWYKQKQWI